MCVQVSEYEAPQAANAPFHERQQGVAGILKSTQGSTGLPQPNRGAIIGW